MTVSMVTPPGEACSCVWLAGGAAPTLNLQVHLSHFRKPVAEVHG